MKRAVWREFLSIRQCTPENNPEIPYFLWIYFKLPIIVYFYIPLLCTLVLRVSRGVVSPERRALKKNPGTMLRVKFLQEKFYPYLTVFLYSF